MITETSTKSPQTEIRPGGGLMLGQGEHVPRIIEQVWAYVFNARLRRKTKTSARRKINLYCPNKFGKECKFYIK